MTLETIIRKAIDEYERILELGGLDEVINTHPDWTAEQIIEEAEHFYNDGLLDYMLEEIKVSYDKDATDQEQINIAQIAILTLKRDVERVAKAIGTLGGENQTRIFDIRIYGKGDPLLVTGLTQKGIDCLHNHFLHKILEKPGDSFTAETRYISEFCSKVLGSNVLIQRDNTVTCGRLSYDANGNMVIIVMA